VSTVEIDIWHYIKEKIKKKSLKLIKLKRKKLKRKEKEDGWLVAEEKKIKNYRFWP
jgi:hypothetical protein